MGDLVGMRMGGLAGRDGGGEKGGLSGGGLVFLIAVSGVGILGVGERGGV